MSQCQNITVNECLDLRKGPEVRLIDIRTADEYARESVRGADNLSVDSLFKAKFDSNDKVIFYCQSGNRTRQAEGIFNSLGLDNVYILDGGLNAWKKSSQQTVVNKKAPLPLMRQVQIIVGFMVVLGVILGLTISPYLSLISAFFGGGLLFAGLSGFCGLANALMFLPYNKTSK
jgi:rhodanese-related sulfurtransferase